MALHDLTAKEIREGLAAKRFSAEEVAKACLARIASVDGDVHALLQVVEDAALEAARAADAKIASGQALGPIEGVPVLVKDNMLMRGTRTTSASKILERYESPYDATVVAKLRAAGAVILGKTNMDEFAMGSSTENSAYGPTRNPWNLTKVPGGSSGGSAAAVAARMAPLALGSDTGGSIRQPAGLCGIVGMKPTYGRVSRYGLMSMASSLDQIGPFARTVEDAAELLSVIEGRDPMDSTSAEDARRLPSRVTGEGLEGLRIGVPKEYFVEGMDAEVEAAVRAALAKLEELGADLVDVSLPSTRHALAVYYVLMPCEVSANLARYDGMRFGLSVPAPTLKETYFKTRAQGFGREVRRRIMVGTHALSSGYYDAYYLQAQKVRTRMKEEFDAALAKADLLVSPTSPGVAWNLGEKFEDPLSMYLTDIYTVSANVVGAPAISVPCGFARDLPVGLQLIGRAFDDRTVLDAAARYQGATEWAAKAPML